MDPSRAGIHFPIAGRLEWREQQQIVLHGEAAVLQMLELVLDLDLLAIVLAAYDVHADRDGHDSIVAGVGREHGHSVVMSAQSHPNAHDERAPVTFEPLITSGRWTTSVPPKPVRRSRKRSFTDFSACGGSACGYEDGAASPAPTVALGGGLYDASGSYVGAFELLCRP